MINNRTKYEYGFSKEEKEILKNKKFEKQEAALEIRDNTFKILEKFNFPDFIQATENIYNQLPQLTQISELVLSIIQNNKEINELESEINKPVQPITNYGQLPHA